MRKLLAVLVFSFPILAFSSCACPEMKATSTAWKVIGPEYKAYVAADPLLDADQKKNRIATVDILDKAIAEYEGH